MEVGFCWKCVGKNFESEVVNFGLVLCSWDWGVFEKCECVTEK